MTGMTRPRDQAPEAEPPQQRAHRALCHIDVELGLDRADEIGPAPTYDAMIGQIGAGTDPLRHFCLLFGRKKALGPKSPCRSDNPAKPSSL